MSVKRLEQIGFYTLSDARAASTSDTSPMQRCELILTNRCNFNCPYCRGRSLTQEDTPFESACEALNLWIQDGLKNIRFSGGEPTLYARLDELILMCKKGNVNRIAISTNGSAPTRLYDHLIDCGVNDFSISLDACCAAFGDKMAGVDGKFDTIVKNIRHIAQRTYVTVGVVVTEDNAHTVKDVVRFAHELGVADIRIISAAQYNKILEGLDGLEREIIDAHPILKYRIENLNQGVNVRGLQPTDSHTCYLVQDDSLVVGNKHYPCVIYMREGGEAIGTVGANMRQERMQWMRSHDCYQDPICRANCLDVCIFYNNKVKKARGEQ